LCGVWCVSAGCIVPRALDEAASTSPPNFDPVIVSTTPPADGNFFPLVDPRQPLTIEVRERNLDQDVTVRMFADDNISFIAQAVLPKPTLSTSSTPPAAGEGTGLAPAGPASTTVSTANTSSVERLQIRTRDLAITWCSLFQPGPHVLRILASDGGFTAEGPPFDKAPESALSDEVFVLVQVTEQACP
jgi:hypothetical protein